MPSARDAARGRRIAAALRLIVAAFVLLFAWDRFRALEVARPELFPWTPLSLADPVGPFTRTKLAALSSEPQRCAALVMAVRPDVATGQARRSEEPACGFADGIAVSGPPIDYGALVTACPVAATLAVWEREVVAPAARAHLGTEVVRIDHLGSYSCRRLYGRAEGAWSEHATANALDIAGFRLSDGRRISVLEDWEDRGEVGAFLRQVRDGACGLFATTLSPDYNAAHRDHLHLDMAMGRARGPGMCR